MAQAITPEQVTQLISYERHQRICKQWVRDIATYLRGLTGEDGARAGKTPTQWATQRAIAGRVINHPNHQDFDEWCTQMTSTLKGKVVWENDLDGTVDFLSNLSNVANYDGMTNEIYTLRASREEF